MKTRQLEWNENATVKLIPGFYEIQMMVIDIQPICCKATLSAYVRVNIRGGIKKPVHYNKKFVYCRPLVTCIVPFTCYYLGRVQTSKVSLPNICPFTNCHLKHFNCLSIFRNRYNSTKNRYSRLYGVQFWQRLWWKSFLVRTRPELTERGTKIHLWHDMFTYLNYNAITFWWQKISYQAFDICLTDMCLARGQHFSKLRQSVAKMPALGTSEHSRKHQIDNDVSSSDKHLFPWVQFIM